MKFIVSFAAILVALSGVHGAGCSGDATACDSITDESSCTNQKNCQWIQSVEDVCYGTALDCVSFNEDYTQCESQSGCTYLEDETTSGCFHGDTEVLTPSGSDFVPIKMKNLKVGDYVWTPRGEYEKVVAFGHHDPTEKTSFVKISMGASGSLELTPEHMLFVAGKGDAVRADSVQVGDELIQNKPNKANQLVKVTKVATVTRQGIYAPLTAKSGTIVANGVAASSYIGLQSHGEYANLDVPFTDMHIPLPFLSQQFGAHMALAPLRLYCSYTTCEVAEDHDIQPWVKFAMGVTAYAADANILTQVIMATFFTALFALLAFLESVVLPNLPRFVIFVGGGVAAYYVSKKFAFQEVKSKQV
jgi:hypothetical protein